MKEESKITGACAFFLELVDVKDFGDISYEPISINKNVEKMQNLKNIDHVAGVSRRFSICFQESNYEFFYDSTVL